MTPASCRNCGYFVKYAARKAPQKSGWIHTSYRAEKPTDGAGPCDSPSVSCNGPLHNTDGVFDPTVIQCSECEPMTCDRCGEKTHPNAQCTCWDNAESEAGPGAALWQLPDEVLLAEVHRRRVERATRAILDAWYDLPEGTDVTTDGLTWTDLARRSAAAALAADSEEAGTRPAWIGTVLESCIRDVALDRIASHSSVTPAMVADWRRLNPDRATPATERAHRYDPTTRLCTCGAPDHPEWGVTA